jgi:hypothetical protein
VSYYPLYEVPGSSRHVLRDRKAWNTDLEECDVAGTNLPRDIARDTKLGIGVAAQAYRKIIDVVNHCLGMAELSKHGTTYRRLPRTG